ncbi:MAG: hypothetical protein U0Q15_05500 [Kineosporiaceae bacterium]
MIEWTGWGVSASPIRDDERFLRLRGDEMGSVLLHQVHSLEEIFYSSDAHLTAANLAAMAAKASDEFRVRHPELSIDALSALAWCYTYDYK